MEQGDLDVVQSCIEKRTVYEQNYRKDSDAQKVLGYYLSQVAAFRSRLETVDQDTLPSEIQSIMRDSRKLLTACDSAGPRRRSWRSESPPERPSERLLPHYVPPRFVSDFDKFLEDLHLLADLIQGEGLFDLLRLDIWSSRPQLYEVWVMLSILGWIEGQGYRVELRRAVDSPNKAPFEWDLAYSRDSRPCATVFDSSSTPVGHLFYQLYRPSGDMPDISMLKETDPFSAPVWSVDPKHSPRRGYALTDYRRTAERYRDSFGAKLSLVAECFPRPWSNPTDFGDGAKLFVDCNPSGSGLPLLLAELQTFHPPTAQWLLCIDFSSSFADRRDGALQRLRGRVRASGEECRFVKEYVCFAGNAVSVRATQTWLTDGTLEDPGVKGGTSFAPLYRVIGKVVKALRVQRVVLVTDGEFDIPLEVAKTRLENDLSAVVEVFM
jgi:hypothetical protein